MQVLVHLLVADHRECRVFLKPIPLVFLQDSATVSVQVNVQYDIRLFGDNLDVGTLVLHKLQSPLLQSTFLTILAF